MNRTFNQAFPTLSKFIKEYLHSWWLPGTTTWIAFILGYLLLLFYTFFGIRLNIAVLLIGLLAVSIMGIFMASAYQLLHKNWKYSLINIAWGSIYVLCIVKYVIYLTSVQGG